MLMMTITIGLSDEHARKLKHLADHAGVSADELIRETVQNWLEHSDQEFAMAAAYVIEKNSELYRRLAR
jgi:antitoxin FitA